MLTLPNKSSSQVPSLNFSSDKYRFEKPSKSARSLHYPLFQNKERQSEGNNEDKEISRRFIKINHKEESKIREKLQLPPLVITNPIVDMELQDQEYFSVRNHINKLKVAWGIKTPMKIQELSENEKVKKEQEQIKSVLLYKSVLDNIMTPKKSEKLILFKKNFPQVDEYIPLKKAKELGYLARAGKRTGDKGRTLPKNGKFALPRLGEL